MVAYYGLEVSLFALNKSNIQSLDLAINRPLMNTSDILYDGKIMSNIISTIPQIKAISCRSLKG